MDSVRTVKLKSVKLHYCLVYSVVLCSGKKSNLVNTFPPRVKRGVIYSQISSSLLTKIVHSFMIQTGRNPMSNSTLALLYNWHTDYYN